MSEGKYSSFEQFNKYIVALLHWCQEDPKIQGLMLIGSIGRQEEDQQSDINVEIFLDGQYLNDYASGKVQIAPKLGLDLVTYYKNGTLNAIFDDLIELTAKFIAIETATPQKAYLMGRILVDKKGLLLKLVQRVMELGGKIDTEGIERDRAEARNLLLDAYYEYKRQNLWEVKKKFNEIRLIFVQVYGASCGQLVTSLQHVSDFAEDWFVEGLQRCIIPALSSIPKSIRTALSLLNDLEQHCHLEEHLNYKHFDDKLFSLTKG